VRLFISSFLGFFFFTGPLYALFSLSSIFLLPPLIFFLYNCVPSLRADPLPVFPFPRPSMPSFGLLFPTFGFRFCSLFSFPPLHFGNPSLRVDPPGLPFPTVSVHNESPPGIPRRILLIPCPFPFLTLLYTVWL